MKIIREIQRHQIYKTFLFEKTLGNKFELDESGYFWLIPIEQVKEVASRLCDIDPDSINFSNYDANNSDYLLLADSFSPNEFDFDILANTFTYENNIIGFDVKFYDILGSNDRGELLYTFRYEFSSEKYKGLISCYKFIKATKVE